MLVKVTLKVTTQTLQNTDNHKSYSGKIYSKCRGYTCIQTKDDKPCTINNSSGP